MDGILSIEWREIHHLEVALKWSQNITEYIAKCRLVWIADTFPSSFASSFVFIYNLAWWTLLENSKDTTVLCTFQLACIGMYCSHLDFGIWFISLHSLVMLLGPSFSIWFLLSLIYIASSSLKYNASLKIWNMVEKKKLHFSCQEEHNDVLPWIYESMKLQCLDFLICPSKQSELNGLIALHQFSAPDTMFHKSKQSCMHRGIFGMLQVISY